MKKAKASTNQQPLEPHELAGELTHEQRVALAGGLAALYRRKVAEDAERRKAPEPAPPER
jgi:hypothetical protein